MTPEEAVERLGKLLETRSRPLTLDEVEAAVLSCYEEGFCDGVREGKKIVAKALAEVLKEDA